MDETVVLTVDSGAGFEAFFEDHGITVVQNEDMVFFSTDEAYALYEALEDYFHGDDSEDDESLDEEEEESDDCEYCWVE
jgi:hypothetical protein